MMSKTEIERKIKNLQEQQQNLINEANRQIGILTGKIEILQEMAAEMDAEPQEQPNGTAEKVEAVS